MKTQVLSGVFAVGAMVVGSLMQVAPSKAATIKNVSNTVDLPTVLTPPGPKPSTLSCAAGSVGGATLCVGSYDYKDTDYNNDVTNGDEDNLATKILRTGVFQGITAWKFDAKDDNSIVGSNTLDFKVDGIDSASGTFNFASGIDWANTALALSLKSGTSFSIYYIAAGALANGTTSIDWNTLGVSINRQGIPQGLSHASVYYFQNGTTPIPTPALLPGLIGMGLAALQKRKQAEA